jgi:hypothetical protein
VDADACQECGAPAARTHLDNVLLCDSCADKRISELTGLPRLPAPPPPITLCDGEGRKRTLGFRVWRAPTGVEVVVEETGVPLGEGYERAVLGAHDADVDVLVGRLREIAAEEVGRRQLEPNPHRDGWVLVDDTVEGRLVWDAQVRTGGPYKVAVDGRLLSWDELGRALEAYEGWRLRIELLDRIDDLRPDADVIALRAPVDMGVAASQPPTIDELLTAFLAGERERLAPRTYGRYEDVVALLRSCLNSYGHQDLDDAERARFEAAYESDEEAFVHLFGADKLIAGLAEFLGYFMVRKVMAGEDLLRAAGTVTKRLAKWLEANGHIDGAAAAVASDLGAEASRDLPRAERLGSILFEEAEGLDVDLDGLDDDDVVEDYLTIERVEPGELWFDGGIGPVRVPKAASDLAQPGWSASITLAKVAGRWRVVEIGNVYP